MTVSTKDTQLTPDIVSMATKTIDAADQDNALPRAFIGNGDSLISLFEKASQRHADRVAIVCDSKQVSYSELNRAANHLSRRLIELTKDRRGIVAIYLDRSIEMLVAMLGVLKAGSAYLPIDPGYPSARVIQTLEDANPLIVVTTHK